MMTGLERVIYFYISLMENVVIEETHECQIRYCYETADLFIYVREEHNSMFLDAMKSAAKRIHNQNSFGILWVMYMDDSIEEEYWQLLKMGKKYFFEDNGDSFREDFIKNYKRGIRNGRIGSLTFCGR